MAFGSTNSQSIVGMKEIINKGKMKQCQWKPSIEIFYVAQVFKLVVGFARKPVFNDKEVWSNRLSHVPIC